MTTLKIRYSATGNAPFAEHEIKTTLFHAAEDHRSGVSQIVVDGLAARYVLEFVGGDLGEHIFSMVEGPTRFLGCVVARHGKDPGKIRFVSTEPA